MRHLQLVLGSSGQVQDRQREHLGGRAARLGDVLATAMLPGLDVQKALQEGVPVGRVESDGAATVAVERVKSGRLENVLKAGKLAEIDLHFLAAAALLLFPSLPGEDGAVVVGLAVHAVAPLGLDAAMEVRTLLPSAA